MAPLTVATSLLTAVALLPLAAVLVLFVEVVASFLPRRRNSIANAARPRIAVLVPAHDEALHIAETLSGIRAQMAPGDRLVVVADNCSDSTGQIADVSGAEVVYRTDERLRGKSYALAHGIRYLSNDPPEIVAVIDADCRLGPGCLSTIGTLSASTRRPVQARNVVHPPQTRTAQALIASFAWKVKCYVRPMGLHRLGLPCQLMGTGMAIPWPLISAVDLDTGELSEDLVLGLELARNGTPPLLCLEAQVSSAPPPSAEGQRTQRRRWETGHLTTIGRWVPKLLIAAVRQGNLGLLTLTLDAAVPPLALLLMIVLGTSLAGLAWAVLAGAVMPLAIAGSTAALLACSILLAWWKAGRDILTLGELAKAPAYAISKIPLYSQIFAGKQVPWLRSKRD